MCSKYVNHSRVNINIIGGGGVGTYVKLYFDNENHETNGQHT